MVWMGSRSNVAAITALDITDLQDNICYAATSELKFLMLQKTSTATVDSETVWSATPSGRWHLVGGSASASSIDVLADLAALKALTSASQDKLYCLNTTPPILYSWDAESTTTDNDDTVVKLTAVTTGRMYKIHPVSSGNNTVVSSTEPSTVLASGTTYIWTENNLSYPADEDGIRPNSLITYVSNGSVWIPTNARPIVYRGSPSSVSKLPSVVYETWIDTSASPAGRYGATINSSAELSWELI